MGRGFTGNVEIAASDGVGLDGLTFTEAAIRLGQPIGRKDWLYGRGYRLIEGRLRRIKSVNEIEDEISARSVTYGPCFRCGGRVCGCGRRADV